MMRMDLNSPMTFGERETKITKILLKKYWLCWRVLALGENDDF